jgi:hypothetical protein
MGSMRTADSRHRFALRILLVHSMGLTFSGWGLPVADSLSSRRVASGFSLGARLLNLRMASPINQCICSHVAHQ